MRALFAIPLIGLMLTLGCAVSLNVAIKHASQFANPEQSSGKSEQAARAEGEADEPTCSDGDVLQQNEDGTRGCVPDIDWNEKPDSNHYPVCPWQQDLLCDDVS